MASKTRVGRLRSRRLFDTLKRKGNRVHAANWLMLNFSVNADGKVNVGWTLPGYVGSAVVRNRLKRWIRTYVDKNDKQLSTLRHDVNLVFKRQSQQFYKDLSHKDLDAALSAGFKKIYR